MEDVCEKANEIIKKMQEDYSLELSELSDFIKLCESPAEQILVATIYNSWESHINKHLKILQADGSPADFPEWFGIFTTVVELQKTITTNVGDNYRADLYIYLTRWWGISNNPEWGKLVVEVDGHDFHEKTKEQASYDRRRDRELTLEGYKVIRFTGSDVFNRPEECVEEIAFQLSAIASGVFDSYLEAGKLEELLCGSK